LGRALDEIEEPDLILTMTRSHAEQVIDQKPLWGDRVFTLKEFVYDDVNKSGSDISDPIGGPESGYIKMKNQVKDCLNLLLEELIEIGLV
jgi:protein-tyrosine-phosphatase